MFDIGWSELMIIAVVALVVIGPKDLPQAIYAIGKWVRKARLVARDFQGHLDDMMREAELDDLRKQALKARDLNIKAMVENQIDPKGDLKAAFELPPEMTGVAGHAGSPPEDAPPLPPADPLAPSLAEAAALPPVPAEAAPAEAPKAAADSVATPQSTTDTKTT
ncbi:MAG TPA: Sec-independent protein translocase protein TatB [Azospirillum sp.]|nr:Sec-independent protein translocase protein TatB [Azospirillum sp.]